MGANNFIALATIPAGAGVGPQATVDLWALVPSTGLDAGFSAICQGDFIGTIALEGSLDGVKFNPVGSFSLGFNPAVTTFELSPIIITDVVRYIRASVMGGALLRGPVYITLGGAQNCDCSGGGTGGVSKIIAGEGIAVSPPGGTGDVTVTNTGVLSVEPGDGVEVDDTDPKHPIVSAPRVPTIQYQLALSYGQGPHNPQGDDDLDPNTSFWFQAQSVLGSPEPNQIHEWPTARALLFVGLIVFVDAAEIILDEGGNIARFIITINGIDTSFEIELTQGLHADEILEASGFISVPANSRLGVRFDGSGVANGSTLRCEMMLDGASTEVPSPPPPIPTNGLLIDLNGDNYTITDEGGGFFTGHAPDSSGNGNNMHCGATLLIHTPAKELLAFNEHTGITFDRNNSFGLLSDAPPVWYGANAPRTMAMVIRGDNINVGTLLHARATTVASHNYQLSGASLPQIIWINGGAPALIQNTNPFFDLNGQKAVLMWWTNGGIGDPLFMTVNGVAATPDATMAAEGGVYSFLEFGYDEGVYFPDSFRFDGSLGRMLTWNRVLSVSERSGVLSKLTELYL